MKTFVLMMLRETGRFGGPMDAPEFAEHHVLAVLNAETAEAAARLIGVEHIVKCERTADPFEDVAWANRHFPLGGVWSFYSSRPETIIANLAHAGFADPVAAVRKYNFDEPIDARVRCRWLIGEVPLLGAAAPAGATTS